MKEMMETMEMTETPKAPGTLATLRDVNAKLRFALMRLRPERRHCSTITPQDFSAILAELLRAAECFGGQPAHREEAAALENEALEYRRHLEVLKQFLPDLQLRLLAEKSRLEGARTQVAAATAWARARNGTL